MPLGRRRGAVAGRDPADDLLGADSGRDRHLCLKEDADVGPPAVFNSVHVDTAQPRSSSLWSEARRLALKVSEVAPWLMSGRPHPAATSSVAGADAGAGANHRRAVDLEYPQQARKLNLDP